MQRINSGISTQTAQTDDIYIRIKVEKYEITNLNYGSVCVVRSRGLNIYCE